jgi:gamma-glutamyltranspeptidase/glutathione hydrolase
LATVGFGALAGGRFLAACGPPPAPTSEPTADLSPASWGKEELEKYAALEQSRASRSHLATGRTGVIAGTSNAPAIRAGLEALRQGGSAVDAALVTALAQIALNAGAAFSYAGILAMMYYDAVAGQVHSLNAAYNVPRKESNPLSIPRFEPSGRTALVPGFMAGVQAAHDRFGKLSFEALFEPAIYFAQEGFRVSASLADRITTNRSVLSRFPETRHIFTKENGEPYGKGDWFRQPALAKTLRAVAIEGAGYMYRGPWAEKFVEVVQREGGKIIPDDLVAYQVIWPEPVHTVYGKYQVYGPGPPALGGVDAIKTLDALQAVDWGQYGHYTESPEALFRFIEIANRFTLISSSPREPTPVGMEGSLSLDARLVEEAAQGSRESGYIGWPGLVAQPGERVSGHTAAIAVVDQWDNVAVVVHSINTLHWGMTGIFVDGVSIPDSASFQPTTMTRAGPGSRLPDGLNPLLVLRDGEQAIGSGAIGSGLHLETMVRLINILEYGMDLKAALDAPTFLSLGFGAVEGRFDDELLEAVRKKGLVIKEVPEERQGAMGRGYWTGVVADLQTRNLQGGVPGDLGGYAIGY